MAERLKPPINQLAVELQRQLNFKFDSKKEWLFDDEFNQVGGIEYGESLPARTRVSKDGTRFEVGARVQDLEGLLELNRIIRPTVQTVDAVINFWKNNHKFATRVEDEWVYIGANIEPTIKGLETEYGAVNFAYDVALESAISGRSYEELARDEKWDGHLIIKQIQEPGHARTGLFDRTVEEEAWQQCEPESEEGVTCETIPPIAANNLREFPLDTNKTSLDGIPGTMITWDGRSKELERAFIIAHNGRPEVEIFNVKSDYDSSKKEWSHDRTAVTLPIPEGVEIKTVKDLVKLHKAQVKLLTDQTEESAELDVDITVQENSFRIAAQESNNPFSLEIRTSTCTDCQVPYWKFRTPTSEEAEEDCNPYKEFGLHFGGGGRGYYECYVDTPERKKLYCFDCVKKLEAAYLEKHPTARRSTAIEIAKGKLAEAGYPDVQIWDTQVWRMEPEQWELFTYIEYERDGKTIRRHAGIPTLADNGDFEPNMQPREYIDFRYKAA